MKSQLFPQPAWVWIGSGEPGMNMLCQTCDTRLLRKAEDTGRGWGGHALCELLCSSSPPHLIPSAWINGPVL